MTAGRFARVPARHRPGPCTRRTAGTSLGRGLGPGGHRSRAGALEADEHPAGARLGGEDGGPSLGEIVRVVADLQAVPFQEINALPDLPLRLAARVSEVDGRRVL